MNNKEIVLNCKIVERVIYEQLNDNIDFDTIQNEQDFFERCRKILIDHYPKGEFLEESITSQIIEADLNYVRFYLDGELIWHKAFFENELEKFFNPEKGYYEFGCYPMLTYRDDGRVDDVVLAKLVVWKTELKLKTKNGV
jgi:hypothetical protein